MEDPEPFGLFLGCAHEVGEVKPDSSLPPVRTMTYNVEAYLRKSIDKYLAVLPPGSSLKKAATPFLTVADPFDVARPSGVGHDPRMCPWCRGVFDSSEFLPPSGKVKGSGCKTPAKKSGDGCGTPVPPEKPAPRGVLAEKAASVLMQILYAARYARFDLLCAVSKLAQRIATWDEDCDRQIYRLMCYIHSTLTLAAGRVCWRSPR